MNDRVKTALRKSSLKQQNILHVLAKIQKNVATIKKSNCELKSTENSIAYAEKQFAHIADGLNFVCNFEPQNSSDLPDVTKAAIGLTNFHKTLYSTPDMFNP